MTDSGEAEDAAADTRGTSLFGWASPVSRYLARTELVLAAALVVALVAVVVIQVIARYVVNSPITWSGELARFILVWLTFIAAAAVAGQRAHIAIDLVPKQAPRWVRAGLEALASLIVMGTAIALIPGSVAFLDRVRGSVSPALQMPTSWWQWSALVGFGLIALHALLNAIDSVGAMVGQAPVADIDPALLATGEVSKVVR